MDAVKCIINTIKWRRNKKRTQKPAAHLMAYFLTRYNPPAVYSTCHPTHEITSHSLWSCFLLSTLLVVWKAFHIISQQRLELLFQRSVSTVIWQDQSWLIILQRDSQLFKWNKTLQISSSLFWFTDQSITGRRKHTPWYDSGLNTQQLFLLGYSLPVHAC